MRKSILVASLACPAWLIGQAPYVPPGLPTNTSAVITVTNGFPRPSDTSAQPPGYPCPINRYSGVRWFGDSMGTADDPNDDRDYFISCRSDGIMLIDATAEVPLTGPNTYDPLQLRVPSSAHLSWVAEVNPVTFPTPDLQFMNGWDPVTTTYVASEAYCWPPSYPDPYQYNSSETTNREAVQWYDPVDDKHYIVSTNRFRPGIWVIPLTRSSGVLRFSGSGTWWTGSGAIGSCHMIYIDDAGVAWVTDNTNSAVHAVQVGAGGALTLVDSYFPTTGLQTTSNPAHAHDAMPVGSQVFVSVPGDTATGAPRTPLNTADWRGRMDVLRLTAGSIVLDLK